MKQALADFAFSVQELGTKSHGLFPEMQEHVCVRFPSHDASNASGDGIHVPPKTRARLQQRRGVLSGDKLGRLGKKRVYALREKASLLHNLACVQFLGARLLNHALDAVSTQRGTVRSCINFIVFHYEREVLSDRPDSQDLISHGRDTKPPSDVFSACVNEMGVSAQEDEFPVLLRLIEKILEEESMPFGIALRQGIIVLSDCSSGGICNKSVFGKERPGK